MRIVLKISGESLKGNQNIDEGALEKVLKEVKSLKDDNELIIVIGGGNFWRGRNKLNINSSTSDYIGMLATCMNAIGITSYLNKNGISTKCYSAIDIKGIIEKESITNIKKELKNNVIVLGGGTSLPGFSTDMTTVNTAVNYDADLILMSKNVDGIYDKDPKEEGAKKFDNLTHEQLFEISVKQGIDGLLVMDFEALASLVKHKIPLYLYNNNEIEDLNEVLNGNKGTRVRTK